MNKIKIEKDISNDRIEELGLKNWPTWEKEASEFPWKYQEQETCYIIEGHAEVVSENGDDRVVFEGGDLVVFPQGLKCIWKISKPIKKYYKFGK